MPLHVPESINGVPLYVSMDNLVILISSFGTSLTLSVIPLAPTYDYSIQSLAVQPLFMLPPQVGFS